MQRWARASNFGAVATCGTPEVWPVGAADMEARDDTTWLIQDFEVEVPVTVALEGAGSGADRVRTLRVRQTIRVRVPLDADVCASAAGAGEPEGESRERTEVTRRFTVLVPVTVDMSGEI